jgi:hypothetical protein
LRKSWKIKAFKKVTAIGFFTQGTVTAQIGKIHLAINQQYGGK